MKYSTQIKPISYLKAHTAEIALQLTEQREPMVITQNGEARFVIQDIASFAQTTNGIFGWNDLALLDLPIAKSQNLE